MKPSCTICKNESRFLMKKDGYDIWACPKCLLFFVHPQPSEHFLAEEVYSPKSGYQGNKIKDLWQVKPSLKQRKLLHYLSRIPKGKFLDIGCSSGEIMYMAKQLGFDVSGIELNRKTADIARKNGLAVEIGTLENTKYEKRSFDIIHMGDLIEHVRDPRRLITLSSELLKPSGQMIIVTPNMDCFWGKASLLLYKFFRIPWSAATPPHHLFQFSKKNLQELMEQNNFVLSHCWYTGTPSLKYELGSLHLLKKYKEKKSFGNLVFMFFSFFAYSVLFAKNRIIELFPVKRFSMAAVFERQSAKIAS